MSSQPILREGTVCPYCRAGFAPEDAVTPCPACGTLHHADCFADNGGCTIFGCTAGPADEPKISVAPADLHPAPPASAPFASIYNLNQTPSNPAFGTTPAAPALPPPLPPGSPPPPAPFYQTAPFPAYAYPTYVRPKSRVAFVLLAVFLGSLGVHNFYAGYNKRAAIQLCATLLTCFWASPFMWIWAIVEACTVSLNDDGVPLS